MAVFALLLPTRLRSALAGSEIVTVGDLRRASDQTILSFQDIGRGSLAKIRQNSGHSAGSPSTTTTDHAGTRNQPLNWTMERLTLQTPDGDFVPLKGNSDH